MRDEVILAAAGILEMADTFYAQYREFLADAEQGLVLLADFIAESQERHAIDDASIELLTSLPDLIDDKDFPERAAAALARMPVVVQQTNVTAVLETALRHPRTGSSPQFRFLLAAAVAVYAWRLRIAVARL